MPLDDASSTVRIDPARRLEGSVRVPGDKSIGHRALLFGAIARGATHIRGLPDGQDVASTARVLAGLGVRIEGEGPDRVVHGRGVDGLRAPDGPLDCGNSGTTMRMMAGLLAGRPFESVLVGDESLSRRPMRRVLEPLEAMGARTRSTEGHAPIAIHGGPLHGIHCSLPVASAQVKSALLLAGLQADGPTVVEEPGPSRDHSERMLRAMGARLTVESRRVTIEPAAELAPLDVQVPGDVSSAAFFLVAGSIVREGRVVIERVGVNPTRTGVVDVLRAMGASIEFRDERIQGGEPVADLVVSPRPLRGVEVAGEDLVVRTIDELPVLAAAASLATGRTVVLGAGELRIKETDRITAIVDGLRALGARIEELEDGFAVEGPARLRGAPVDSRGDHRIAMALAVAALAAEGPTTIANAGAVAISYPGFFRTLDSLRG